MNSLIQTIVGVFKSLVGPLMKAFSYFWTYRFGKKAQQLTTTKKELENAKQTSKASNRIDNLTDNELDGFWLQSNKRPGDKTE